MYNILATGFDLAKYRAQYTVYGNCARLLTGLFIALPMNEGELSKMVQEEAARLQRHFTVNAHSSRVRYTTLLDLAINALKESDARK